MYNTIAIFYAYIYNIYAYIYNIYIVSNLVQFYYIREWYCW